MNKKINNNYLDAFDGLQIDDLDGGTPIQPQASETSKVARTPRKESKETYVATENKRRAVEKAQNANRRGRGRKIEGRVQIHFDANSDLAGIIEDIHFERGVTKTALYNEALRLLVEKYHNIKPANNEK